MGGEGGLALDRGQVTAYIQVSTGAGMELPWEHPTDTLKTPWTYRPKIGKSKNRIQMEDLEIKDRESMLVEARRLKEEMYSYMRHLNRLDHLELAKTGYSDLGSALVSTLRTTIKKLDQLVDNHVKKYPDA